jgi:hypothetical protein
MNGPYSDRLCVACRYRPRRRTNELFCSGCRLDVIARLHTIGYLEGLDATVARHDEPHPARTALQESERE